MSFHWTAWRITVRTRHRQRCTTWNVAGLVVISHNSQSFSAWTEAKAPGAIPFPRVPAGTCSNGDGNDPGSCPKIRDGKLTNDGWTIDNDAWQGVRTVELSVGQWNTPDAYAGECTTR
jgi:hypothetical protein